MDTDCIFLLRFGKREHLTQLRESGLLHMNPQRYFSKIEEDELRGDRFEGSDRIVQPSELINLTVESKQLGRKRIFEPQHFGGPLSLSRGIFRNIYCMLGANPSGKDFIVDERNCRFADSFVAILDTKEF